MNFKKSIALLFIALNIASLPTYAGVSKTFKDKCASTTAKLVQSVQLVNISSDVNKDSKGIYISSSAGKTWFIPGGAVLP
ncbi:hypothetical protein ACNG6H_001164 [Escherichia coli]